MSRAGRSWLVSEAAEGEPSVPFSTTSSGLRPTNNTGPPSIRDISLQEAIHYSYVLRWLRNLWRKRLTPLGRMCLILMVFFGLSGSVSLAMPLYIPWGFLLVLLAVSRLTSMRAISSVQITRHPIAPASAGQQLSYDIEVTNTSHRTLYELEVTEWYLPFSMTTPEGWDYPRITQLGPGESVKVRMKLVCTKRGSYTLPQMAVMSAFPMGVWRGLVRQRQETSFLVYPSFKPMLSFAVPHSRQFQPGGILLSSQVGDSSEFMHTREYRDGDNPRHIHWASWARQNKPIIKVYQEEYFVRLALLLDSEWTDRKHDAPFEAGISLAAGIADVLSRQEYIIDIFAAGEQIHHFQAGRALAHLDHILEILSCISAAPAINWEMLSASLVPQTSQFSSIVLVFLNWDEPRKQLIEKLHSLGVSPRVFLVREDAPTLSFPSDSRGYVWVLPTEDFSLLPAFGGLQADALDAAS